MGRRLWWIARWFGGTVFLLLALAYLLLDVFKVGSITLPESQPVQQVVHLEQGWPQGWKVGETHWFHHANQGTKVLRYDWFLALERPELSVWHVFRTPGLFSSEEYLTRFGFLPSERDQRQNPDQLPVGFAVNDSFQEPFAKQPYVPPKEGEPYPYAKPPYRVVGLTCAACHTTQVNYNGTGIRIEGGPGMVDLGTFKDALGRAIFYTNLFPWRFDRFARRVLGNDYSPAAKAQLRAELKEFLDAAMADQEFAAKKHLHDLKPGFARTDALGLILNRVFKDLNEENLGVTDAPVNFPHIWDATWFDWVQYNASIRPPMVRNIGEALGVGGMVNLDPAKGEMWKSTVDVENLHRMEQQLSGPAPFQGLRAPKWPAEILGAIDSEKQQQGKALYDARCKSCHWLVDDATAALEGGNQAEISRYWTDPNDFGKRFLKTNFGRSGDLERIGTDASQALNFARRVVVVVPGQQLMVAGQALDYTTSRVREQKYKELGLTADEKIEYDAFRLPWETFLDQPLSQRADGTPDQRNNAKLFDDFPAYQDSSARLAYKARPLNGIWATAPFLHNGSVPNLYQLLSPATERDKTFYLGSKEFDPEKVGVVTKPIAGGSLLDTSLPGNLNLGHEFRDLAPGEAKSTKGVLGPALKHDERMALIEYLKSL